MGSVLPCLLSFSSFLPKEVPFHLATMPNLPTSKLVPYAWSDLFNLVLDLKSYPEFVPHCRAVRLLSCKREGPHTTIIVSRMTVGFLAFEVEPCHWRCFEAFNHGRINRWPATVSTCCLEFRATGRKSYRLHFSVNYEFSSCWHPSRLVVVSPATLEKHVAPYKTRCTSQLSTNRKMR